MKITPVTKVHVGFSVAIFGAVVVLEMVAGSGVNVRQPRGAAICLGFALVGALVWLFSTPPKTQPTDPDLVVDTDPKQPPSGDPLLVFRAGRFWGFVILASALVLAATSLWRYAPPKPEVPAREPVRFIPPPPVVFPPLKLTGLVVNGSNSSALINGQVLHLGEGLEGVHLVGVDAEHAIVELQGQTNVLRLAK